MHTEIDRSIPDSLRVLREIITKTMERLIERTNSDASYGWIDMKFDALTGDDTGCISGIRDRNHIYSWIQGRGLEAITTHIDWFRQFPGMRMVDDSVLLGLGKTLAARLILIRSTLGGHFPFLLDSAGDGLKRLDGRFTMSDLFCARGLYAYFSHYGTFDERKETRAFLKQVVDAILSGNFLNDQVSFDPSQYKEDAKNRTSYAGFMLALGAVTLLMRTEQDIEAVKQGKKLIDHIVEHHLNIDGRWPNLTEHTVVEWIDSNGEPYRSEGVVALDPGHALEFVGLAAQMIHTWRQNYAVEADDDAWIEEKVKLLFPVLKTNLRHGYHSPGGILKSVDAETGRPLHDSMPWWALPETLRALVLLGKLSLSPEVKAWTNERFISGLRDFERNYYRIAKSGVAVQTINTSGSPVPVIPATPDLDPGYHTGLSLIDCYTILGESAPLVMGKAEIDITPQQGMRLSGHVARVAPSNQILDSLHIRVCILESPYTILTLISADALEFSTEWATDLQAEIADLLGIHRSGVFLTATHTHTAPPVLHLGTLPADSDYLELVRHAILQGCGKAGRDRIPVRMFAGSSTVDIGINRRLYSPERERFEMKPNPQGSRDDSLGIVVLKDYSAQVQAIWFNTAVHPTTLGVQISAVSADYPGRVATTLKSRLGEKVLVIPLTGACGDVRPAVLSADLASFREGTESDIEQIGVHVAQRILEALPLCEEVLSDTKGFQINHALRRIQFPLRDLPTREHLEHILKNLGAALCEAVTAEASLDDFTRSHDNPTWAISAQKAWAERLLAQQWPLQPYIAGDIMMASLGNQVVIFTVPGELFASVGLRIKNLIPDRIALLAGYTGGSLGYLPSSQTASQSGYETNEAFKYYGAAGPFSKDTEDIMVEAFRQLLVETVQKELTKKETR